MQPLRDLEMVRAFLSGMGPTAFLDMPWMPIFLLALFIFHPLIGLPPRWGRTARQCDDASRGAAIEEVCQCGAGSAEPSGQHSPKRPSAMQKPSMRSG